MTGVFANPGYPGRPAFFSNPIYYPAYNVGNPGYYGAFGNPAALYAPNLYGYPIYSGYAFNYWNPAFHAGYPAAYPYGYQGCYGGYAYLAGYSSAVQSFGPSDQEIKDEVINRLNQDDQINMANIEVTVDKGVVTLNSEVKSEQEVGLAENLAFSVGAVRDVRNQLEIGQQPGQQEQPKRRASSIRQRRKPQKKEESSLAKMAIGPAGA